MKEKRRSRLLLAAALIAITADPRVVVAEEPELNQAQRLVFIEDHLRNVAKGSVLEYDFSRKGDGKEGFSDTVTVTVTDVLEDGRRDLEFNFLSGGHHIDFHPAVAYRGNPVMIHFLERDILEMSQVTDGHVAHFRNRVRDSFKEPEIRSVKIPFEGEEVDGVHITVRPFVTDPYIDRFERYANKRYDFEFSERVPGGLYNIHTLVPGDNEGDVLIEERLSFRRVARTE